MDVALSGTEPLLTVGDAARILGLSTSRVRQLAENGTLTIMRTSSGIRLFPRRDIERLSRLREQGARGRPPSTNHEHR